MLRGVADPRRRNLLDKGGGWFVDTTCIDCDVARQLAPGLIEADERGLSYFARPPATPEEEAMAWRALLSCPTGSIGARGRKPPADAFPFEVAPGAFLLGYNSADSFGASAYLVPRPGGNLMVDAPRWVPALADAIERRGGVAHVLLTHRDDVADWDRYAARFGARVWIHKDDADAAPGASDVFRDEVEVAPGVAALPVPGHTRGSAMFLVDDRLLFTGDSLAWSRELDDLHAFRDATWHSWEVQADALEKLAARATFEWVLPGHGGRGRAPPEEMRRRLRALVGRMRGNAVPSAW
ncbi:MAG TPA: MBL fold metallo-hydrolase [Candidatus Thermoplasmatota archaeon]|nr:MBL fold metallo-hydrolase [Candidatus Thermoplasmatota archaeon]